MSLTKRLLILIPGILLLGLAVYLLFGSKQADVVSDPDQSQNDTSSLPVASPSSPSQPSKPPPIPATPPPPPDPIKQLRSDLKQLSTSFAETWGSYSNQQSVSNVANLFPFMTKGMSDYVFSQGESLFPAGSQEAGYVGVTTRVLSSNELVFSPDSGVAKYLIITQRVESRGSSAQVSRIWYQDIEIHLQKDGGFWKVDGVFWGDEREQPQ